MTSRSLISLLLVAAASTAWAADDDLDKVLARERWKDSSYGVSLRPPLDTRIHQFNADDAVIRITKDDIYSISVYIKHPQQEMTIDQIVRSSIEQMGFLQPTAKIMDQSVQKPAQRPGWLIYFGINLPLKDLPDAKVDPEELKQIAREQLKTADTLRAKKRDIDAYRLYKTIADNSPDKAVAAKAAEWKKAFEGDHAFMAGYVRDEARRRKTNARDADNKPWVMGQAFMQLSPQLFVMLRMEVDHARFAETRPVFESVIRSIEVQNPQELSDERKKMLERGDELRKHVNHKRLVEAMQPEVRLPIVDERGNPAGFAPLRVQYMRIVEREGKDKEQDIGWMKTVHRERQDQIMMIDSVPDDKGKFKLKAVAEERGVNGVSVDVYARVMLSGGQVVDTISQSFLSETGQYESWAIRTSMRELRDEAPAKQPAVIGKRPPEPAKKAPAGPPKKIEVATSWTETGVRNNEQIILVREGPTGIQRHNWRKPPKAYLSQVELYLLGPLLPRRAGETSDYGFYAYYSNTGSISYRTVRVVPGANGNYRVFTRPTPDSPEQISEYDSQGVMIGRELGENRTLVPTTREELAKIHNIKLPDETINQPKPEDVKPLPPSNRLPR